MKINEFNLKNLRLDSECICEDNSAIYLFDDDNWIRLFTPKYIDKSNDIYSAKNQIVLIVVEGCSETDVFTIDENNWGEDITFYTKEGYTKEVGDIINRIMKPYIERWSKE